MATEIGTTLMFSWGEQWRCLRLCSSTVWWLSPLADQTMAVSEVKEMGWPFLFADQIMAVSNRNSGHGGVSSERCGIGWSIIAVVKRDACASCFGFCDFSGVFDAQMARHVLVCLSDCCSLVWLCRQTSLLVNMCLKQPQQQPPGQSQ